MRIAIDARCVQPKLQGVGRYVLNLLLGLSHKESELEFLVLYSNPMPRKVLERVGGGLRSRFQWIHARTMPGNPLEKIEIPWLLRIHNTQLYHDTSGTSPSTFGIPTVCTVHELAGLRYVDRSFSESQMRRRLNGSRLIIAVSQSVAGEIEDAFHISRPKIRVIGNAIDPRYSERVTENEIHAMRERLKLPGKYFLCVTADRFHKNAEFVQKLAAKWDGPETWVFTLANEQSTGQNPSGSIRYVGSVEDVWLKPLYAACTALIVPSLYEGFSLPPLEGLALRALPVVSDIPAHHEALDSVLPGELFFNPTDSASLEHALKMVLNGGDSLKTSVLEKFRSIGDRYSFIERAEQVQAVYREALT